MKYLPLLNTLILGFLAGLILFMAGTIKETNKTLKTLKIEQINTASEWITNASD